MTTHLIISWFSDNSLLRWFSAEATLISEATVSYNSYNSYTVSYNSFPHIADKIITDQSLLEELVKYSVKTMSGACDMNDSPKAITHTHTHTHTHKATTSTKRESLCSVK